MILWIIFIYLFIPSFSECFLNELGTYNALQKIHRREKGWGSYFCLQEVHVIYLEKMNNKTTSGQIVEGSLWVTVDIFSNTTLLQICNRPQLDTGHLKNTTSHLL